ncbi:hypothetical protein [Neisseria zoodegmatis]|uniref:hypothetical protein n=1 Tax=Neisseria zoodegmatis TaxID=326523 RepID=UPI00117F501F|nr:hypothetical protein [Neisseria zoodegmatis]
MARELHGQAVAECLGLVVFMMPSENFRRHAGFFCVYVLCCVFEYRTRLGKLRGRLKTVWCFSDGRLADNPAR